MQEQRSTATNWQKMPTKQIWKEFNKGKRGGRGGCGAPTTAIQWKTCATQ